MQDYITVRAIYLNRDYKENFVHKTAYEIYEEVMKEWMQMSPETKKQRVLWARREMDVQGFVSSSDTCEEIIQVDDYGRFIYKKYDISFTPRARAQRKTVCR